MRNTSRYGWSPGSNNLSTNSVSLIFILSLQKLLNAVSAGHIDEMVAILTSGIDINTTLEVRYSIVSGWYISILIALIILYRVMLLY